MSAGVGAAEEQRCRLSVCMCCEMEVQWCGHRVDRRTPRVVRGNQARAQARGPAVGGEPWVAPYGSRGLDCQR
jgi:hypothetical protein